MVNNASIGSFVYVLTNIFVVNERTAEMYRDLLEGGVHAPVFSHEFTYDMGTVVHRVEQRR